MSLPIFFSLHSFKRVSRHIQKRNTIATVKLFVEAPRGAHMDTNYIPPSSLCIVDLFEGLGGLVKAWSMRRQHPEECDEIVSSSCKFMPEPATFRQLVDEIKESTVGKLRGDPSKGYVLIPYDSKTAGESGATPSERQPNLRAQHVRHLVTAVMRSRPGSEEELAEGDMYCFFDGGRHGNKSTLLGAICDEEGKSVPKIERPLQIVYSQESMEARKNHCRGFMTHNQLEQAYVVTKTIPGLPVQQNLVFPGSTQFSCIGPAALPNLDECWSMSVSDKNAMYGEGPHGTNRPMPGGRVDNDVGTRRKKRLLADIEPVTFWSLSEDVWAEVP